MSIPAQIGRYKIKSELGRGGMGIVYLAIDPSVNREVAIKVLPREMPQNLQLRARFMREIKTVAKLVHPSIVPVYDVGEEGGQSYFVMRFMTGGSLSVLIANGKIPLEETARIVEKIAQGLAYAHREGVIHRDLKPDNILFDDNGDPFISDFGVARSTEFTGSLTGNGVMGTPAYMSPEQARGNEIDNRSDVYSLGVIVYQMLSGRQPYSANTPMDVVSKPVPDILSVVPGLPLAVDIIIKRAMAKDLTKRYSTAVELADALNLAAFEYGGNLMPATNTSVSKAGQSSRGKTTGLLVAGIILAVMAAGIFLLRGQLFAPPQVNTPVPSVIPTEAPTEIPTEMPTATLEPTSVPETATPSPIPFAPACAAEIVIPTPAVKATNKICTDKKPYTVMTIPDAATFDSLSPDMKCVRESSTNGIKTISCGGPQLYSYELKVCLPSVVSSVDSGKCDQGSTFDEANQCCFTTLPEDAGCTIFKVDLRACQ